MRLIDIYGHLKSDLEYVESWLEDEVRSHQRQLQKAAAHLLKAGGKRIRPVFVLISGQFGQYDRESLGRVAVILELIHMATLVHDDVIDDANTRRGNPTVRADWGNRMAMYTGDFIFAKAMMLLSKVPNHQVQSMMADAMVRMCEGEIEQIRDFYGVDQTLRTYLRRIKRKTALLIALACTAGGMVSSCTIQQVRYLNRFGYNLGMAFQIVDDILDLTSTASKMGKPVGSDMRQGNLTVPVLYALRFSDQRDRLMTLIHPDATDHETREAVRIVKESGGIQYARDLAEKYLEKALRALHQLPDISSRNALEAISKFVTSRDH